jgi:hypothetical protein
MVRLVTKAIICVCSPRVDSFANAITHLVDSWQSLDIRVFMLSDNYATAPGGTFIDDAIAFLDDLSAGMYQGRAVSVSPAKADLYRRAVSALQRARDSAEPVYIRDFAGRLRDITKKEVDTQVIVDVTSLPKPLAADVTVTCTFRGLRVFSFELTRSPDRNRPENSMYHAISASDFRYPCLTDPVIVRAGMHRFISKKNIKISILAVCAISVICFVLLIWLGTGNSTTAELVSWIGLVASFLGIGTGVLQLAGTKEL